MTAFQEELQHAVTTATKPLREEIAELRAMVGTLVDRDMDRLIPLHEAAEMLGVHPTTLRNRIKAGTLECTRQGKKIYFEQRKLFANQNAK